MEEELEGVRYVAGRQLGELLHSTSIPCRISMIECVGTLLHPPLMLGPLLLAAVRQFDIKS